MSARIVHFGEDRFNRLGPLKEAGYSVDTCCTLEDLRVALDSEVPVDAFTLGEGEDTQLDDAIVILRSGPTVPLIFFQGSTHSRNRSDFDLVVPLLARPGAWLAEIADLIDQDRALRSKTQQPVARLAPPDGEAHQSPRVPGASSRGQHSLRARPKPRAGSIDPSPNGFLEFNSEPVSLLAAKTGPFLKALSPETLRELELVTSFSFCAPGTVLFVEGQPSQEIFVLLEGQVKVYMNSHDGRRLTVHIAAPGEVLGLSAAFTSALHRATAETLYPCRIACIPCSDFLKFLLVHPKASQAAAKELGESCDRTYTRLRTIGVTPSNRAKLARLLLEWATQGKQTERGTQIHLALKHGEIAECIGTCRESVTRILRDLQRWQVIEMRGSLLVITDVSALEQCACLK